MCRGVNGPLTLCYARGGRAAARKSRPETLVLTLHTGSRLFSVTPKATSGRIACLRQTGQRLFLHVGGVAELLLIEPGIEAAAFHQFGVDAALDDAPAIHH